MAKKNGRGFTTRYRCYNFTNKNPVIDQVRTVLQDEGMYAKKNRRVLSELSGVATNTFDGWFEGDTKNPQHATIMATLSAIGYEERFVKVDKKKIDIEAELEAARAWSKRQKAAREAYKAHR